MIERVREHLIAAALATTEDSEQHLADIKDGRLDLTALPSRFRLGLGTAQGLHPNDQWR